MKNNAIINNKQQITQNGLRLPTEMSTQEVVRTVQALGVLIDLIYSIYVLIIVLNLIQTYTLTKMRFSQLFAQNVVFYMKFTHIEARIFFFPLFFFFLLKQRVCSFFWYFACSDVHTTKYSGGHEIFEKMTKNTGGGWQLKKTGTDGERVKQNKHTHTHTGLFCY